MSLAFEMGLLGEDAIHFSHRDLGENFEGMACLDILQRWA
jgi:hypothetical protein